MTAGGKKLDYGKSKDLTPEQVVRRLVHGMGIRYRLHVAKLPGAPDLVFPGPRRIIIVNDCFEHMHTCARGRTPPSPKSPGAAKRKSNVARDQRTLEALQKRGWEVLVVWGCQTTEKQLPSLRQTLKSFLKTGA